MAPNAGMSVAIVGAGFAGICMGVQLKKAGAVQQQQQQEEVPPCVFVLHAMQMHRATALLL